VELRLIEARKQNAYIENFNAKFRDQVTERTLVCESCTRPGGGRVCRRDECGAQPHTSFRYRTPAEFAARWKEESVETLLAGLTVQPGARL